MRPDLPAPPYAELFDICDLGGRTALVTGSSQGIGHALAGALADPGFQVEP